MVCDNMQRQVLLVKTQVVGFQAPLGLDPMRKAAFWTDWFIEIWSCCNRRKEKFSIFFTYSLEGWRQTRRCIIYGRTWHHYSCWDRCALRRLNCAHCANFEHVSPNYHKLCAPVHIPRGCAQYIVQVYITWTLRSICRWSWLNIYLLIAIWCCY